MRAFLPVFVRRIDGLSRAVGRVTALVLPIMMLVIVANVVLRYGFGIGMIEFEELQWHLNALIVMGCLAYAYRDDSHVRVDVVHARLSARGKAWVELVGGVLLLLPFVIGIAYFAWDNFAYSLSIGERSPMPSGLPARFIIKFVLFAGFVLLGLQGLAAIGRSILTLCGRPLPPIDVKDNA
ncbi:TRAP transporter small permease subunit [Acuticoccus kandeliae]|uniref:TRAP transporter small permease subunit n=1 Tax=Acuticoccus kandeliae TaxID=2073160 RepID=UPI000D3EAB24|nr:TRAP transporter small permease subunit [Acuticoccus kandeliae]